jgi:hypothetical protein
MARARRGELSEEELDALLKVRPEAAAGSLAARR